MPGVPKVEDSAVVVVGPQRGVTIIPQATALRRLNYFDGKFLRAEDLRQEQTYLRHLVGLSNQAGGPGIVHGFDAAVRDDALKITAGLAIDRAGRVLHLPGAAVLSVTEVIERSAAAKAGPGSPSGPGGEFAECETEAVDVPTVVVPGGLTFYVISVLHADAMCGHEEVFARICEEACSTASDRPYRMEGVVVRADAVALDLVESAAVTLGDVHLRSRMASAWYGNEETFPAPLISKPGLGAAVWCRGARGLSDGGVAIGLLARAGSTNVEFDGWAVRRERMETTPRRYWAIRTRMRPWDVFLAQVLQFQCQLVELTIGGGVQKPPDADECAEERATMAATAGQLSTALAQQTSVEGMAQTVDAFGKDIRGRLVSIQGASNAALSMFRKMINEMASPPADAQATDAMLQNIAAITAGALGSSQSSEAVAVQVLMGVGAVRQQMAAAEAALKEGSPPETTPTPVGFGKLIDGGIVELPPAGYLPVDPAGPVPVPEQVRRQMGDGVDLRFCVGRSDVAAHLFEESQHLERISLLTGLDDPSRLQAVDVLVPDGKVAAPPGTAGAIVATRDWVLFHRRREVDCTTVAAPQPVKTDCITLFRPAQGQATAVTKKLENDDPQAISALLASTQVKVVVQSVEYDKGARQPKNPAAVAQAWKAQGDRFPSIGTSVVGVQGVDVDLLRARAAALAAIAGHESPDPVNFEDIRQGTVPGPCGTAVVLIPAPVSHEAFMGPLETIDQVVKAAKAGTLTRQELDTMVERGTLTTLVARMFFEQGTTIRAPGGDIRPHGFPLVHELFACVRTGDSAEKADIALAQAEKMLAELKFDTANELQGLTVAGDFFQTDVVDFISATPVKG